jgi:hypothetical protein
LVGGAVGEPPVLFAEDILQNERQREQNLPKKRSGLKTVTRSPEMAFGN